MDDIVFLTLVEVIDIHNNQIELYGGSQGVRDHGLILETFDGRQENRALLQRRPIRSQTRLNFKPHPSASITAVVQKIIQQASVTPHGSATSSGAQVSFSSRRILIIAQTVSHIGNQLYHRDL